MKKYLFLLMGCLAGGVGFGQNPALLLPQSQFDSDTCCWRKLSREGRYQEAAQLLIAYLKHNKKPPNKHSLNWHAGQLLAMAEEPKLAKKYFRKTYCIVYKWFGGEDGRAWYYYAKGTVAFVDQDRPTLEKILRKWQPESPADINYKALGRLLENWGKPYREAY